MTSFNVGLDRRRLLQLSGAALEYGTLTGRLQFDVDHDWFERLGASLPKPQFCGAVLGPKKYPCNSPHTRWAVHSFARTEHWMLRHQRGEPDVRMSPKATLEWWKLQF